MHVQTCRMRVLSYPDSLYQDDGTVFKKLFQLPDCWTEYLHQAINQSINQSTNLSIRPSINQYSRGPTYRYTGILHLAVFRLKGPSGLARATNECSHQANYVSPL